MIKIRFLKAEIKFTFVADDGDNLEEIDTNPVTIPASGWGNVSGLAEQAKAQIEKQIAHQPPTKDKSNK